MLRQRGFGTVALGLTVSCRGAVYTAARNAEAERNGRLFNGLLTTAAENGDVMFSFELVPLCPLV